jgi:CRP/FNR family transcriptional regulator, cyclic AMP receptor protein
MQTDRIELLQAMPIFGAIGDSALRFLLDGARQIEVVSGGWFFREGDQAQALYVLQSGRAAVLKRWQGRDHLLHSFAAGDCFGEMALMDPQPRCASVCAVQDCEAIELSSANLYRLFEHDVEQFALIQMNIGREVCRRLRATDELLFRATMGESAADAGISVYRAT